jgi:hypothetical protein
MLVRTYSITLYERDHDQSGLIPGVSGCATAKAWLAGHHNWTSIRRLNKIAW